MGKALDYNNHSFAYKSMIKGRSIYEELFSRNTGFISNKEQEKISELSVGIAGAGGDGGLLAERLVRFGIGKIILADPEIFETNNANRQFAANINSFGKNKARAVANELTLINPNLEIIVFEKGIDDNNIKRFVNGSDIIIDEIEYLSPSVSALLAKETRKQNKYLFMGANIGWGASIFCFSPEGVTFEEYFQYNPETQSINVINYVKKVPKYFSRKLLSDIIKEEIPMPGLSSSVGLVASLLSSQIILFVAKNKRPAIAPEFMFFDTFDFKLNKRR